jgi:hypothetical protein
MPTPICVEYSPTTIVAKIRVVLDPVRDQTFEPLVVFLTKASFVPQTLQSLQSLHRFLNRTWSKKKNFILFLAPKKPETTKTKNSKNGKSKVAILKLIYFYL